MLPRNRSPRENRRKFCWPFREEFSLLAVWAELRTNRTKDEPEFMKQDLPKRNQRKFNYEHYVNQRATRHTQTTGVCFRHEAEGMDCQGAETANDARSGRFGTARCRGG